MKKYGILQRTISLLLSLVLVASCLPAGLLTTNAADDDAGVISGEIVTDPSTLNAWQDTAFNPEDLTTEHAGGVWTDKTVLKQSDIQTALPGVSGIDVADGNFLVALSALGANSVVAGQGATPTDTIFVLDVSNSMGDDDLLAMVNATNDAIHSLLTTNEESRIGVVVYATSVNTLLPLDRYTPVTKSDWWGNSEIAYIEMSDNYGEIRTARHRPWGGSTTYLKNSNGQDVTTSISASGATYIQGGLWQAYQMFNNATVSDNRAPVLVLMSDGAPTYGTEDFNNVTSRDVGNGGTNSVTDGLAFLTQLTAAYVKEKISDKYGVPSYFYSVGLNISENGQQVSIAEAVLNTSETRTNIESNWTTYLGLANAQNKTMSFNAAGENVTVSYDSTIAKTSKTYTDRYFSADDASQLSSAFQGIVNEINLKSSYTVTRLEGVDVNTNGYVTFVDEIGTGMEVKDIKGILIGNLLFSGEMLAKATEDGDFGTEAAPTALGLNQVWALQNRLRIEATDAQTAAQRVWELLRQAKAAGQIHYSANSYSNYVGWFGDTDGKFVGFWDTEDETPAIPANAAYANMCYGMLGTTTDSQTAHASDMMYVAITVSKAITDGKIKDNTPQTVTFRIPASLLPTITYQIDVQAANDEEITESTPATITYNPAEPIRLLYEVGVHSKLNGRNIQDFLREGYQAKDADGNYYLYTNAWYWEPSDGSAADFNTPPTKDNAIGQDVLYDTSKNHITYAYFEPGVENEHYYYTEDTALYTRNGNTYTKLTTAPVTDGSVQYYFQHKVYESQRAATQTGVAVDAQVNIHYGAVSQKLLQVAGNIAQGNDGVYYIKEGTMHYGTIHDHDREKTSNETSSYLYRLHQLVDIGVDGDTSHHYEIAYLGNNGRITYAPAQGLKLSKVMNDGSAPDATFTFEVALTAPVGQTLASAYETVHVARNGAETSGSETVVGGKLTVRLMPGESIYILGLPTGTSYTVTEQKAAGYRLASSREPSGTIANNTISEAVFTNAVRQAGALTVSKWVTYEKGVDPTGDTNEFTVIVTLKDGAENFVGNVTVDGVSQSVTDGKLSFKIKHNQSVVIAGIPEDVTYTVAEDTSEDKMPKGYTWTNPTDDSLSGAITAAGNIVELANTYSPESVKIGEDNTLNITFNKRLDYQYTDLNGPYDFSFTLRRYNPETVEWEVIDTRDISFVSLVANMDNYAMDLTLSANDEILSSAGEHYFRLAEVPGSTPGMVYDFTHHDFKVVVADTNYDSKLEIADVQPVDSTVSVVAGNNEWSVSTQFNNRFSASDASLSIQANKTLTNTLTNENVLKDGQFSFALYETDDSYNITGKTPAQVKNGANGDIVFPAITYKYGDLTGEYTYYHYVMAELDAQGNPLPAGQPYTHNGVTYTPHTYHINVSVHKETQGEAVAQVNYVRYKRSNSINWNMANITSGAFNEITFANTYTPASAKAEITAEKTLTNRTPGTTPTAMEVPANTYSFTLEAIGNAPTPTNGTAYAAQGGGINFGEIEFKKAGTYTYKITENDTGLSYVSKDSAEYTAVVTVTDDGQGRLHASVSYLLGGVHVQNPVFNNIYRAESTAEIVLGGTKVLDTAAGTDRDLQAGEFQFVLTKPDGTTETVRNTENGGEGFKFSPVSFNAVGTYDFTVSEVIPHNAVSNILNGIAYSAVVRSITVIVTDDGSGKLVANLENESLATDRTNNVVTFENRYEAKEATVSLTAHKDLEGRDLNASEFTFQIEALTTGAPMPANPIVANDENGNVEFKDMTFTAVGDYLYRVTELDANNGALTDGYTHNGVTYSQKVYTVTVTVRDTGNGNLVAQVSSVDQNGNPQPGGIVFTNTYKAASVTIHVEGDDAATSGKLFTDESSLPENKKDMDDFAFRFTLYEVGGDEVQTVEDNGQGFSFDPIEFTEAGTYRYLVYERMDSVPGVIYDYAKYRVTVTVTDNGQGHLEADVVYEKAESGESDDYQTVQGILFQNSYKAKEATHILTAKKTLTGRTLAEGEFTFVLRDPTTKQILASAKNDASGNIQFPAATYNAEGTYTYLLEELAGEAAGITYDATQYTVTVTVEDNEGVLEATATLLKGETPVEKATFSNTFTPTPGGSGESEPEKEPEKTPEKEPEKTPEKEPEKTPEIDSPQTGDTFHLGVWILMLCVSAMGVLVVLLLGRKEEAAQ